MDLSSHNVSLLGGEEVRLRHIVLIKTLASQMKIEFDNRIQFKCLLEKSHGPGRLYRQQNWGNEAVVCLIRSPSEGNSPFWKCGRKNTVRFYFGRVRLFHREGNERSFSDLHV